MSAKLCYDNMNIVSFLIKVHTICDEFGRAEEGGEKVKKIVEFERQNARKITAIDKNNTQNRYPSILIILFPTELYGYAFPDTIFATFY